MCGICGIIRPDKGPIAADRVVAPRHLMTRRGPDACGLKCGPGFALDIAGSRSSICRQPDTSPWKNEDGSVIIVFNGEIYNFADLRPSLEQAGHRFRSHTDTETLIHGDEQWGIEGLLRRVRGMYAFAIEDVPQATIHLARDPLGKKPLFFRWADGELLFASSARRSAAALDSMPEIDPVSIDALLWTRYIPGPRDFRRCGELSPGHAWQLKKDGTVREFMHWQPDFFHPQQGLNQDEWIDRVEDSLCTAVRRRFVADVPVGVMLSGGVDSGLVTAIAAKTMGTVKTFCVANEDLSSDESRYAQAVAQRYRTEHHVLAVRSDVRANLPQLAAAMGEPLADASAANLLAIAQLARQSVTVVLTGDGGDEAFGGYTEFWAAHLAQRAAFSARISAPDVAEVRLDPGEQAGKLTPAGTLLRISATPLEDNFGNLSLHRLALRNSLYTPQFQASLDGHQPCETVYRSLRETAGDSWPERLMQAHMQTVLADDYLPKVDLALTGASIEGRCPFLDLDVIELAMRMPEEVRFSGGRPKGLLRQLAHRYLLAAGIDRRKQGFNAPVGLWFRRDWNDLTDDFILGPHVERRGWFRRDSLQRLVQEHARGIEYGGLLWAMLILELWVRMTVENAISPEATI